MATERAALRISPGMVRPLFRRSLAAAELDKAGDDPRGRALGVDGDGLDTGAGFGGVFNRAAGRG